MRDQESQQVKFSHLDHDVREQLDITWIQYVLLDMVYHLSVKYGFCYMTKSTVAKRLGVTLNAVKYQIDILTDRELLINDPRGLICGAAFIDIAYTKKRVDSIQTANIAQTAKNAVNRGDKTANIAVTAKTSDKINNTNKKINKKDLVEVFDKINTVLQTKSRYSEAYGKLIAKALTEFTAEELTQAAEHFRWKFHGGSDWHTSNQRFFTLKQFLSGDREHVPRYQTCFEESQDRTVKTVVAQGPNPNRNPNLDEFFPL